MEINFCSAQVRTKNGIKTDKRLVKTKKAIVAALIELLAVKDLSEITVTELTDKAGINRKTFYLHYNKIDDVIADFGNDLFIFAQKTLVDNVRLGSNDMRPLFATLNHTIEDNLEFFRLFVRSGAAEIFISSSMRRQYMSSMRVTLSQHLGGNVMGMYAVEYILSGIASMYRVWLESELPSVSLDTVSDYACEFVSATLAVFDGVKK